MYTIDLELYKIINNLHF